MAYEPKYSIPSGAKPVKTTQAPVTINGKSIPGYQTTFSDGTSKWIRYEDASLSSNFDYSTFTGYRDSNGKWTWSGTTDKSITNLSNATGLTKKQIEDGLYRTPVLQNTLNGNRVLQLGGIEKARKIEGGDTLPLAGGSVSNPDNPVDQNNPENQDAENTAKEIDKEAKSGYKDNTRPDYFTSPPLKYPLNLSLENQDCIKFSIIKYKPPGLKPNSSDAGSRIVQLVNNKNSTDGLKIPGLQGQKRDILGTIILPIPGGISDRNYANWSGNPLDEISRAFSNISIEAIRKGGEGGVNAAKEEMSGATAGGTESLAQIIASKFTEAATNANNIISRQYGSVINPNLELLFNGPELRSFQFTFRFTPREPDEAKAVKKIIRHFKQAMAVKRSKNSLLLQAPHTFAISYITSDKQHPYLNRFKECALTDCSVNYTPDGTYMTYREPDPNKKEDIQFRSMTAYELTLSFQELEPIFDDDYYEVDQNKDTDIGF